MSAKRRQLFGDIIEKYTLPGQTVISHDLHSIVRAAWGDGMIDDRQRGEMAILICEIRNARQAESAA